MKSPLSKEALIIIGVVICVIILSRLPHSFWLIGF